MAATAGIARTLGQPGSREWMIQSSATVAVADLVATEARQTSRSAEMVDVEVMEEVAVCTEEMEARATPEATGVLLRVTRLAMGASGGMAEAAGTR